MTNPDVPLRLDMSFEVPGTAEQVWDAIATANGISSWFMPTDLDEHEGGTIRLHMGEESSTGTVSGWEPPHRFEYVEPDWAKFAGHDDAPVTPMVTEFLVEARSGGTCVVRIVSSAFGTGADWEREFFDEMEKGWPPAMHNLRLYLTLFAGQRVTSLSVYAIVPGESSQVWAAMRQSLGVEDVGQVVEARGLSGQVERIGDEDVLLRVTSPVAGLIGFGAFNDGKGGTWARVEGYLFSDDAPDYVAREQSAWQEWLQSVAVPAG